MENVDQVEVDFSSKIATVTLKKGILTEEAVRAALKGSKYGVSSFEKVDTRPKEYTVMVGGMTPDAECAMSIRDALAPLEGVSKVTVDLEKRTARITMKPGKILERGVVVAALKKTDKYTLEGFTETEPAKPDAHAVQVGISGMT